MNSMRWNTKLNWPTAIAMLALVVVLAWHPKATAQTNDHREHRHTANAMEMLQNQTIDADYLEVEFSNVLKEMAATTELNFVLDESATDENLDRDALISCKLKDVRIASFLDHVLHEYGCTWYIQDGIVRIVSEDAALDNLQIQTFDCADIISKIKPITTTRTYHYPIVPVVGGGKLGGGTFAIADSNVKQEEKKSPTTAEASGQGVANQKGPEVSAAPRPDTPQTYTESTVTTSEQQLLSLIENSIDPDSWEDNGGNGRLNYVNGILVISQTNANLRGIDAFLHQLRDSGLMDD